MASDGKRILVIGYGNPGRRDDGLGPRLAGVVEALQLPHVTVAVDYQLTVEDAHTAAAHEAVIFADAAVDGPAPFSFGRVAPSEGGWTYSTHALTPADVLALARGLFGAAPRGYVLGVRGYAFNEFGEELSRPAEENLAAAAEFLRRILPAGEFGAAGNEPAAWTGGEAAGSNGDRRCKLAST